MNSISTIFGGPRRAKWRRIAVLLLVSGAASWLAQSWAADAPAGTPVPQQLSERYPAGSIQSVEAAERALSAAARERAEIEARYRSAERACYPKFFTTACLDGAKERRRVALARLRPIEIEAKSFKRRARVAEREQALAEQRAQDESVPPQPAKDQTEQKAAPAGKPAIDAPVMKPADAGAKRQPRPAGKRVFQHEIKSERRQRKDIADAKKRADNVAAYERKVREAELHRRAVAARKAEKERERIAKNRAASPAACCVKQ